MTGGVYELHLAGHTPILAELEEAIGEDEVMRIRIGALVVVLAPELAEDLADAIIETVADRAAAVQLIR